MKGIDMNVFSEAKAKVRLLDIVGLRTTLKQDGNYWKGVCPLTEGCEGEFTVSKEVFYCFKCRIGGDVISYVQKVEDCTPLEAVEKINEFTQEKKGVANFNFKSLEGELTIPIFDHLGRLVAIAGRRIEELDLDKDYSYSFIAGACFDKEVHMFGLNEAKSTIQEKDTVYVTEDILKAFHMGSHGYRNTVALLGVPLSVKHLIQLSRYAGLVQIIITDDAYKRVHIARVSIEAKVDVDIILVPKNESFIDFIARKGHE
jgi:DNA primase